MQPSLPQRTLTHLVDDPDVAAPIGLAVVVAADLERVSNEIFGHPVRALGRALRLRPRPDHKGLQGKLQYDRTMIQTILPDIDKAASSYDLVPEAFNTSRLCLQAMDYTAERLIILVRHYGKLEKVGLQRAATIMTEYKSGLAYIRSHKTMIYEEWGPCRSKEHLMTEYLLRVVNEKHFDLRLWDQIDPEIAILVRGQASR